MKHQLELPWKREETTCRGPHGRYLSHMQVRASVRSVLSISNRNSGKSSFSWAPAVVSPVLRRFQGQSNLYWMIYRRGCRCDISMHHGNNFLPAVAFWFCVRLNDDLSNCRRGTNQNLTPTQMGARQNWWSYLSLANVYRLSLGIYGR